MTAEEDKGEHITILDYIVIIIDKMSWMNAVCTFSRHLEKKLRGSRPYATAEPMIGNQWNTTGGSLAFPGMTF